MSFQTAAMTARRVQSDRDNYVWYVWKEKGFVAVGSFSIMTEG
ncbi:MAG: hypothetical protein WCI09_12370 [Planctomycetota bacterium]